MVVFDEILRKLPAGLLHEVHAARLRIHEIAASEPSVRSILVETLDQAERLTGSRIGFYHLFDEKSGTIELQAWSSATLRESCRAKGHGSHYPLAEAGVWTDGVRQRHPVVHNDYASLPNRRGLPPGHAAVVRELVVPVLRRGAVVAILGIGNKPEDYGEDDVTVVSLLADLAWDVAERAISRRRMAEAERRYDLLASTTLDAFVVVDDRLRIVGSNAEARRLYGYEEKEFLSLGIRDLEAVETGEETERHARVIRERLYDRFESRHRRKDGTAFDVETSVSWLPEQSRFFCFFRDITRRKEDEARLKRQERWLRETQQVGRIGSYRYELATGRWSATSTMEEIFGIDPAPAHPLEEWIGLVHPAEREEMAGYLAGLVEGGGLPFDREYRIVRRSDGQERWVHGRGEFLKDESGRPATLIGTITDTTERKRAERVLEEMNRRLDLALSAGRQGVWEYDFETGFLQWDERMFSIYGIDLSVFRGRYEDWIGRVHADDLAAAGRAVREAAEGAAPYDLEFRIVRPDGEIRHVKADGTVLRGVDGKPLRMIGVNRDVTEQRRIEEQFAHAQRLEAIGRLAGGVAHDINNVLQIVTGNASLLLRRLPPESAGTEMLGQILEAGERGASLARSLLAFGRKQSLERRSIDFAALVSDSVRLARRLVEESIRIDHVGSPIPLPVRVDPTLMQQVIFNLLTNARDALGRAGTIRMRSYRCDVPERFRFPGVEFPGPPPSGEYAALRVSDDGIGIPPDILPRIFEPFFTTKDRGKGTGLGLSMVHGTVLQHGGFLEVESEPGGGTSFTVLLPLAEASEAGSGPDPLRSPPVPQGEPRHGVLVVEDDPAVRTMLAKVLSNAGYRVFPAANGVEALDRFREHGDEIAIVLLDVIMPEMGGPETLARIDALRPGIPSIFLSGYSADMLPRDDRRERAEILAKPVDLHLLLERVASLLGKGTSPGG